MTNSNNSQKKSIAKKSQSIEIMLFYIFTRLYICRWMLFHDFITKSFEKYFCKKCNDQIQSFDAFIHNVIFIFKTNDISNFQKQYLRSTFTHLNNFQRHFKNNFSKYYKIDFDNESQMIKHLINDHRYFYSKTKRAVCIFI